MTFVRNLLSVKTRRGLRYFYGFGRRGQVLTAWSPGGGELLDSDGLEAVSRVLARKGLRFKVLIVTCSFELGAPFESLQRQEQAANEHYQDLLASDKSRLGRDT